MFKAVLVVALYGLGCRGAAREGEAKEERRGSFVKYRERIRRRNDLIHYKRFETPSNANKNKIK